MGILEQEFDINNIIALEKEDTREETIKDIIKKMKTDGIPIARIS